MAGKKQARPRREEVWAKQVIEKELNLDLEINDDGSKSGMYDLRVGSPDAPKFAFEVVGAVDQVLTKTWNTNLAKGPMKLSLNSDWSITITANCELNPLRQSVELLLRELESQKVMDIRVDYWLKSQNKELFDKCESLGIQDAFCCRLLGNGTVYFNMPSIGGPVDEHGRVVPEWVGNFLRDSVRRDVLSKLERSGAGDRQVFVIVDWAGAPWLVESYLTGELTQLPCQAPDLPQPVTGVWVVSTRGKKGLRWDGTTWQVFDAHGEGIDL